MHTPAGFDHGKGVRAHAFEVVYEQQVPTARITDVPELRRLQLATCLRLR